MGFLYCQNNDLDKAKELLNYVQENYDNHSHESHSHITPDAVEEEEKKDEVFDITLIDKCFFTDGKRRDENKKTPFEPFFHDFFHHMFIQ